MIRCSLDSIEQEETEIKEIVAAAYRKRETIL